MSETDNPSARDTSNSDPPDTIFTQAAGIALSLALPYLDYPVVSKQEILEKLESLIPELALCAQHWEQALDDSDIPWLSIVIYYQQTKEDGLLDLIIDHLEGCQVAEEVAIRSNAEDERLVFLPKAYAKWRIDMLQSKISILLNQRLRALDTHRLE